MRQYLTPLLTQTKGSGVIIKTGDAYKHKSIFSVRDGFRLLDADETVKRGEAGRHTYRTTIKSDFVRVLDFMTENVKTELDTCADGQSAIPNGSTIMAYDPKITCCKIIRKSLCVELDEGKKNMSMLEFRESGLKFGLAHKSGQLEYVVVRDGPLRCIKINPLLKKLMGFSLSFDLRRDDLGTIV